MTNTPKSQRLGAEAAIKALSKNSALPALAAQAQASVRKELATEGLPGLVRTRAERLQGVADLFYSLLLGAAQAGDATLLDKRVQRWGWLQTSAFRAWLQVAAQAPEQNRTLDAALAASQEVTDDDQRED